MGWSICPGYSENGVLVTERRPNDKRATIDDRAEFQARTRDWAIALGKDEAVFDQAVATMLAANKYQYAYLWTWMGVPIIQLPADVMATQEVIFSTKPDIIIETGVARGGSVIFMASLLELIGKGTVVGVDFDIRPHNRDAITGHPMGKRITLIEGPSTDASTLARVRAEIPAGATVMVVLDSDHSHDHVLSELRGYGPLVTSGQYMVVADTIVGHVNEKNAVRENRSRTWFQGDEPLSALKVFLAETDRFEVDPVVNGKLIFSSSPGGYLRCLKDQISSQTAAANDTKR
jgi:cephalosporin hydroxylase